MALLLLGAHGGIRIIEILTLDWSHVDLPAHRLTVVGGKGRKDRPAVLSRSLAQLLDTFAPKSGFVLPHRSPSNAARRLKRLCHDARFRTAACTPSATLPARASRARRAGTSSPSRGTWGTRLSKLRGRTPSGAMNTSKKSSAGGDPIRSPLRHGLCVQRRNLLVSLHEMVYNHECAGLESVHAGEPVECSQVAGVKPQIGVRWTDRGRRQAKSANTPMAALRSGGKVVKHVIAKTMLAIAIIRLCIDIYSLTIRDKN